MTAWRVLQGDCLEIMGRMRAESVDAIVTDPPYGLVANKKGGSGVASVNLESPYGRARIGTGNGPGGFMGMAWDGAVPGVPFWTGALRVAKPGAHLLAFGGTRTFHRLAVAIEDAGWEIRDTIAWMQGQGFPKSHNLPGGLGTALKPAYEPVVVARKALTPQQDLATLAPTTREALCEVVSFGKTGTPSSAWLRTSGFWSTVESLKSALDVLSERASTFTTETAFAMTTDLRILNSCLSRIIRACTTEASNATSGIVSVVDTAEDFSRSVLHKCERLASTTVGETAIALPAIRGRVPADGDFDISMEPVIVARKPLVGTVAKNVETFGTGALNVDGCRIGLREPRTLNRNGSIGFGGPDPQGAVVDGGAGRWPANVMLDEDAAAALDAQTGTLTSGLLRAGTKRTTSGGYRGGFPEIATHRDTGGDSGGASRFFYVAKASRSEREAGLTNDAGRANTHPTVKPVAVMRWLCRLVTPPGGIVLDPFCGSGTTGVAAVQEGFRFIGIERESQYVEIARARIASALEAP